MQAQVAWAGRKVPGSSHSAASFGKADFTVMVACMGAKLMALWWHAKQACMCMGSGDPSRRL